MSAAVTDDARKKANLRLLQRTCDKSITEIMATATHVVLYEFAHASWSKTEVEGSLFVVSKSSPQTSYMLTIMNRSSTENFTMPITSELNLQHQEPYLICKRILSDAKTGTSKSVIEGIWFHHAHERIALTNTMEQIIQSLQPQPFNPPLPQQLTQPEQRTQIGGPSISLGQAQPGVSLTAHSTTLAATLAAAHHNPLHPAPSVPQPSTAHSASTTLNISSSVSPAPVIPQILDPLHSAAPAGTSTATPDERAQLAALLSQTALLASQPPSSTTPSMTPPPKPTEGKQPILREVSNPPSSVVNGGSTTVATATGDDTAAPTALPPGVALDKRSLQLALLSLIQDDRFLELLHSQYLRVMKARAKKGGAGDS